VLQLSLMADLTVVAAVLEQDAQILIAQRKRSAKHPLKWEFPGGKVEPGEDLRDALQRELREELGVEAQIGEELDRYEYRYGNGPLTLLVFLRVNSFQGDIQNLNFEQLQWAGRRQLARFDFLEGDLAFLSKLGGLAS
jgi:8-oxo-dGTP diphosphatase